MKRILKTETPVKTNSTFGNWLVRYVAASPFGTRFIHENAYFMRKKDALKWIAEVQAATRNPPAPKSVG